MIVGPSCRKKNHRHQRIHTTKSKEQSELTAPIFSHGRELLIVRRSQRKWRATLSAGSGRRVPKLRSTPTRFVPSPPCSFFVRQSCKRVTPHRCPKDSDGSNRIHRLTGPISLREATFWSFDASGFLPTKGPHHCQFAVLQLFIVIIL